MERLENKTKAQLLDIIDRKDRIECELRNINKTLNNKIEDLNNTIKVINANIINLTVVKNNLESDIFGTEKVLNTTRKELDWYKKEYEEKHRIKNEYEEVCDILATERVEHKEKIKEYQILCWVVTTIAMIIGIIDVMM